MPDELVLITPVNDTFRRDVDVADATLLDPNDPACLIQGEWVVPNGSYKYERPAASVRGCFQVFSPKGDLASQALGKIAVIQLHDYEAETIVFDDAFGGAVGDPLTVDIVPVDGTNRAGLRVAAAPGEFIYGVVTKLPADNGGKLRYNKTSGIAAL